MIKNHIIYNNYSDWTFDVQKAENVYLWDTNGKKYIDFTSGWNVTNLGWNNEEIAKAMKDQIDRNSYAPMWTADPVQNQLAKSLTDSLPKELTAIGRATGGTEANEEAIKTARSHTGRSKIIGFKDAYHGQSYATFSLGYKPEYIEKMGIGPMVGGFIQMDFPKLYNSQDSEEKILTDFLDDLELLLKKREIAAIVTEAGIITGWGSTYTAPKGYLKAVRKLTEKYGTLLILDEVGTGFSRCGELFGMNIEGVVPDIVTFAKAICNGAVPIGAMVTTKDIAEKTVNKSNLTSTFGWMPVACAAAIKTLEIHKRDKVWKKAKKDGDYLVSTLKKELNNCSIISDIRGVGMEIGVTFIKNGLADEVVKKTRLNGLHLVCDHEANIQIMPPLVIERGVLNQGIDIFVDTIHSLAKK